MGMAGRLEVNRHHICSRVEIPRDAFIGIGDHHVDVERHGRGALACLDGVDSEGEVRREMAIHDIDMDEVGTGNRLKIPSEVQQVCGEDGWSDANDGGTHGGSFLWKDYRSSP